MNRPPNQHETQLASLAADYEKQGYAVRRRPAPGSIPFDLNGFAPDLLAEKDAEHLLVLVKDSTTPVSIGRLRDLTETVRQQPGWRFILVNAAPESEAFGLPGEPLSWQGIADRIAHAKRLQELGELEAAFLVSWSALEALLRRHVESVNLPIEHLPVRALIDYLYSEAELSFEQFEKAKSLAVNRNQLAHGFQVSEVGKSVVHLLELIEALLTTWQPIRQAS